jgi:hypothetical protein
MRSRRWDVPFADRHPHRLALSFIKRDRHGMWIGVEAFDDRPDKWQVHFSEVLGFKCSSESFFDWTKWAGSLEASHHAAAYIVEDGDWRDEFWNGRNGQVVEVDHFVISTGNDHFECLAAHFGLFPHDFDPEAEDAKLRAHLSPQRQTP